MEFRRLTASDLPSLLELYRQLDEDDDKLIVCDENRTFTNDQIEALVEFQEQGKRHEIVR